MNFGFCKVSIAPIRAEKSDSSEMVSQLLFGEILKIINKIDNWIFIESQIDKYQGWIDEKQINYITDKEAISWLKNQRIITKNTTIISSIGKLHLTKGAYLHKNSTEFKIGKYYFKSTYKQTELSLISFAKSFINTAYLWGGKSNYGIDCSGFTQIVFRNAYMEIPRDASQQEKYGFLIDFKNIQPGDVAFFKNEKGKIIHVGILVSKSKIIHASGRVKIDKFDENGIYSSELKCYSHTLHSIKRMI